MKPTIKLYSGWIVAAAMAVIMFGSGFQTTAEKTGVVDLNKVIQDSNVGKQNTTKLNQALAKRQALLNYIKDHTIITTEQAEKLRELELKDPQTDADKAAIEKIKRDVGDSEKNQDMLRGKSNLTEAESRLLSEYSDRQRKSFETMQTWNSVFSDELSNMREQLQQSTVDLAKAALARVAKQQGFTTVLETQVAPYGANDLTANTVTSMNAGK
ncbi:MAG: hypothetical protein IT205_00250 [Fimbriimonadaceae bacterium]|jgi:Skp family chaperone for outer membrane proteins|nr:hypothetical protein [Fimbriimonadaceae bacterium]